MLGVSAEQQEAFCTLAPLKILRLGRTNLQINLQVVYAIVSA